MIFTLGLTKMQSKKLAMYCKIRLSNGNYGIFSKDVSFCRIALEKILGIMGILRGLETVIADYSSFSKEGIIS